MSNIPVAATRIISTIINRSGAYVAFKQLAVPITNGKSKRLIKADVYMNFAGLGLKAREDYIAFVKEWKRDLAAVLLAMKENRGSKQPKSIYLSRMAFCLNEIRVVAKSFCKEQGWHLLPEKPVSLKESDLVLDGKGTLLPETQVLVHASADSNSGSEDAKTYNRY